MLLVVSNRLFSFQNKDPDLKILRESSDFTTKLYDVFEHHPVDRYLHAFGLGVKPEYRGNEIAVKLLEARAPLMQALGLTLTFTVFSTLSSQKAAAKAGYFEVFRISYVEVQEKFPHFDFSKAGAEFCKSFTLKAL